MERDRHRQLKNITKEVNKHKKEMQLSRSLKKEVDSWCKWHTEIYN